MVSQKKDWRSLLFSVVGIIIVYLFLTSLVGTIFISPFSSTQLDFLNPISVDRNHEIHRWHDGQWTALAGILMCGTLLALLWKPRTKPHVMQFFTVSTIVLGTLLILFDPVGGVSVVVPFGLLILLYPDHRELLKIPSKENMSTILLILTTIMALCLIPVSLEAFGLQINSITDEHDKVGHWAIAASLGIIFILAGVFASLKEKGSAVVGILLGLALLYLGAASLSIPAHDGSWGTTGGILALAGGGGYIGIVIKGYLQQK